MVELWLSLNVLSFTLAWRPRQPQHPNEHACGWFHANVQYRKELTFHVPSPITVSYHLEVNIQVIKTSKCRTHRSFLHLFSFQAVSLNPLCPTVQAVGLWRSIKFFSYSWKDWPSYTVLHNPWSHISSTGSRIKGQR